MNTVITFSNNAQATIRLLKKDEGEQLLHYFDQLSAETKSRFGPHLFDHATVQYIVNEQTDDIYRYVALNEQQEIIAYMLIKKGLNEGEQYRMVQRNTILEASLCCT
jgi:diamine N-acetyltransferase